MRMFRFSITYLMWLFLALLLDHYLPTQRRSTTHGHSTGTPLHARRIAATEFAGAASTAARDRSHGGFAPMVHHHDRR
jgi:hypothetical protein